MAKSTIWYLRLLLLVFSLRAHAQTDSERKKMLRDSADRYFDKKTEHLNYMSYRLQLYADSALRIDSTYAHLWRMKGFPYLQVGDIEYTLRYYDKTVELEPQRWLAYRAFCKTVFLKDYESGLQDFLKADSDPAIPKYEMDHSFAFWKGICYLELGDYKQAKALFEESIQEQTDRLGTTKVHHLDLFYLGMAHAHLKEYDRAIDCLKNSLTRYPKFSDVFYHLANIHHQLNLDKQALDYIYWAEFYQLEGLKLNETNEIYVNFPEQIAIGDIRELMQQLTKK